MCAKKSVLCSFRFFSTFFLNRAIQKKEKKQFSQRYRRNRFYPVAKNRKYTFTGRLFFSVAVFFFFLFASLSVNCSRSTLSGGVSIAVFSNYEKETRPEFGR